MKVIHFAVPIGDTESFTVRHDSHLAQLHRHSEIQVTLITSGTGELVAGDYVGSFKKGDVFVIGPQQAHVFYSKNTIMHKEHASISLFFNIKDLGQHFINLPEMRMAKVFAENCNSGFAVFGEAKRQVTQNMERLLIANNIERMACFLAILHWLSILKDKKPLSSCHFQKPINDYDNKRINTVIEYTFKNSTNNISLSQVAKIAGLTPEAFCKYFKARTHKTYLQFLNEVRIHKACKLLMQGGPTVATVSDLVGFNSISNFNRVFKKVVGITPVAYVYQSVGLKQGELFC